MTVNLNQVAVTGNLTRDPALVTLASGHVICEMQLAVHRRSQDQITGVWQEWADYFTVKAFGFQARTAHRHLRRGHGVGISGRLSSRRLPDGGEEPHHAVEIIAEAVQFLSPPLRR
jgi:single stranded DNA-binding protein